MMSAATALPPAPSNLPPPPSLPGSTFEAPPLAVIPGDDLTRYILHYPPPSNIQHSDTRKQKKSRSNAGDANRSSEDEVKLPPKLGTGLICIQLPTNNHGKDITSSVRIQATVAGRLVYRQNSRTWFVASNPRRYHLSQSPAATPISSNNMSKVTSNMGVGDRVIGIVEDQKASADYYRINIFGSHSALLHVLSFEGATKRNRPQLEPGCLVYCRVIKCFAGGRMDPEVSCKVGGGSGNNSSSSKGKSTSYNDDEEDDGGASGKDWMTNEGTYGPLNGGTSFRVSIGLARELLLPENAVLSALDKSGIPFEIAIGVNGMVWVNSPEPEITIMILNAIKNSEVMPEDKVRGMVKVMVKNVKKELMDE
jgi:exosome complex RNA-binding protein Rrp4